MRSLALIALVGCSSSPPPRPQECPPAGTEVPYTKLVSPAFKSTYAGCEISTSVHFAGSGWGDAVCPSSPPGVTFRVRGPGEPGRADLLATEGGLAVIRKEASDAVFSARVGDALKVTGKTWVSEWTGCVVLVVTTLEASAPPEPATPPESPEPAAPTPPPAPEQAPTPPAQK